MDEESALLELTVENADKVLDDVRPYLLADGGNVHVEYVRGGRVGLRLDGTWDGKV